MKVKSFDVTDVGNSLEKAIGNMLDFIENTMDPFFEVIQWHLAFR